MYQKKKKQVAGCLFLQENKMRVANLNEKLVIL